MSDLVNLNPFVELFPYNIFILCKQRQILYFHCVEVGRMNYLSNNFSVFFLSVAEEEFTFSKVLADKLR